MSHSPATPITPQKTGFVLTGRIVLLYILAFFGTVFSVNFYMAREAISTFSGLEADKPYQEGIRYDDEIAAARAQERRGWRVDARIRPLGDGRSAIEVRQADAANLSTPGLHFHARFMHPADRRRDVDVDLAKQDPGLYRGETDIAAGRWDLLIEARVGDRLMFRSQNRIDIPQK